MVELGLVCSSTLQSCTDLIGNQFSYLHNCKNNFENLKALAEKLSLVKQRVVQKTMAAERSGEEIDDNMRVWLYSVENLIHEADKIIEDEWKGEKRCFRGLCTNLGTRHKLIKQVKAIVLLLSQGEKFLEISSHPIPEEISNLIASSQNPFLSLWNYRRYYVNLDAEVEKLMEARERVQHRMEVSRRNGEAIFEDVLKWVTNVEEFVDDARRTFEGFNQTANTRCFIGLCPDLITRYHLSNRVVRRLKAVAELRGEGVFDRVSYTIIPPNIWLTSTKVYETLGSRMSTLEGLYSSLLDPHVNMIGVYGMGGIGKTVLVKQVAAGVEINKLFDVVIFAEVGPDPDLKKIQGDIADQLALLFRQENVDGRAIRLINRLKREKNILVILDNIWTTLDLRRVGIPVGDDSRRCTVLLTSRNRDILSEMGSQKNFAVGVIDEEEAFSLFKKIAGDSAENQELQFLAIDIAKACGGLPLAIASIAISLRGKGVSTWRNAFRTLGRPSSNNFTGILAEVYSSIKLSYCSLKSEELKSTFLFCSIMKYSGDVYIMEFLKYGICLGLFEDMSLEKARNKIRLLVRELESSCLLLCSHSSERFNIHDVVRLVARSIASVDEYALTLTDEATDWPDKDTLRSYKAISIHDSNIRELPEGLECPQLRFFNLLSRNPFMKIPHNFFTGMTNLSVLNLTKMHLLSLPSSFHLLVNLRTLCLDKCILGNVAGIGVLQKLEILSLSHSDIKLLPKDLGQLTRLRILDVSNCSKLKVISPNAISSLYCLEELYMGNSFVQWEVEGLNFEGRNASLNELKHLSELTSLEIHIKDARFLPRDLLSSKLERYRIFIGDEWNWFGENGTSRTLKLKGNTSILLSGLLTKLNGIEELCLDELQGVNDVLYQLDRQGFPQLRHLHIRNNSSIECIVYSVLDRKHHYAFPFLESLFLHNLINLEKIFHGKFTDVSLSKLKIVKVVKCDKLKNVFSFSIAKCLPQLQTLDISECKNMEQIFASEVYINNKKVFGEVHIRSLTLKSLPQLKSSSLEVMRSSEQILSDEVVLEDELFSERVMFPMLKVLELAEINIQKIWHNRLPSNMFFSIQSLTHLILWGCDKLKYIFSSFIGRSFVNLQHLEICHCAVLEEIIMMEEFREEERNKIIIFPRLECLVIKELEKLERFCSENHIEFPSLKQLEIEQCPQFKAFILTNISTDSEEISPFFNEKVALPSLEELLISHMDNLKMMWNDQISVHSFQKLKIMEIEHCDNLLTIFPSNICERFWQLESLTVTACGSLMEIFDLQRLNFEEKHSKAQLKELCIHGLPKVTHVWKKDPQVMLSFPKLQIVRVSGCQTLENLFPASIARNLFELEELEMVNCGVEEIVSKEDRAKAAVRFVFPHVTYLKLSLLQRLRCFYPGTHTSEWLVLKKLEVYDCDNVKVFTSKFVSLQETNEYQLYLPAEQALFLVEKVFPHLKELKLGGKVVETIWQGAFPEHLFRRLEVLHIVKDESDVFPLHSFQRFHNLEKLILSHGSCKEILSYEEVEGHVTLLTQIKDLKLFELSNLKYMWKQESKLGTILQNLEILDVWWCSSLINLVPSSASFHNLTVLEVWFCNRLMSLVAFSTAKTLVQLKELKICGCEMMTKVVAIEGNAIEAEINFRKLKSLTLFGLQSLTSFYPGNNTLKFPSLEELFVIECPNMYIFSTGVLSIPNLHEVQQNWAADVWRWDGDLNTTIQQLHKKVNADTSKED